ncbi:DUF3179 domain-containing protein [Alkalibacterium sp. 20]|uniref:DUF3179 domain-containing protein n=1 Tax=Alkalibacterium sp. 20 TaxID=1798803 RepID=UPI0009001A28|nr:DUF3179 domain-containing protein [Alkalibacterium sp. 20]OJF91532.1 hypothetical protein AX762_03180 [Alkalibacterium sp. 20]
MKSRKYKITVSLAILVVIVVGVFVFNNNRQSEENREAQTEEESAESLIDFESMTDERLTAYHDFIQSGGPPPDGIPPIEEPIYESMAEADILMDDQDVVFIVEAEDRVFIYPQRILVWHEIVNEEFNGEKVSITYCPLTGSAIGYKGSIQEIETDFGTSGKLINSNLVMYDRETESYFPQILGIAVDGELKGQRLEEFPVLWSTWGRVKEQYDDAQVLSENTGFIRDYNQDPYGSYVESSGFYYSDALIYPVMFENDQFQNKEVMIAGRVGDEPFAIPKKSLAEEKIIHFNLGDHSLVANYYEALDTARVFIEDEEEEIFVNSYDVMWFAWYAFFPETMVYE